MSETKEAPVNDVEYLAAYRDLAARRDRIKVLIGQFKAVCDSLKNWQHTATSIGAAGTSFAEAWSDGNLAALAEMRRLLTEYEAMRERVQAAWDQMRPKDRIGLADPSALADKA